MGVDSANGLRTLYHPVNMSSRKTSKIESSRVRCAVLYARVSSKEQDKEGFSIPAQLKLLRDYASHEGIRIVEEYVDVETAKQAGRTSFGNMVDFLNKQPESRVLLVEKTDRLYRNLKDWVTLDELDLEIHLIKEGVVLSNDSRSSEKFMHGIKVLMAKNYIDNLSEEAKKGMHEKAAQGFWPTKAPFGYLNVTGENGKKVIEPEPENAPLIVQLFEWYASGSFSLKELGKKARAAGLVYRGTGKAVPTSTIHKVLRNRIYMGEFEWNGEILQGSHQPLVTRELWDKVQGVMDGRRTTKTRRVRHDFAFSGLLHCGHCGCAIVGEIKKQRYVYYHCSGYRGKCGEPYVREEVLEEQFSEILDRLVFDDEILEWVRDALHSSHAQQLKEHEAVISRLRAEHVRLQKRVHAAYADKLDGRIDAATFDEMAREWRSGQARCLAEIARHETADWSYVSDGVKILELAQNTKRLFETQEPREKRRLLDFVLSNCSWKAGRIAPDFRQPFDLIADTNENAAQTAALHGSSSVKDEVWLGERDSNPHWRSQSPLSYH